MKLLQKNIIFFLINNIYKSKTTLHIFKYGEMLNNKVQMKRYPWIIVKKCNKQIIIRDPLTNPHAPDRGNREVEKSSLTFQIFVQIWFDRTFFSPHRRNGKFIRNETFAIEMKTGRENKESRVEKFPLSEHIRARSIYAYEKLITNFCGGRKGFYAETVCGFGCSSMSNCPLWIQIVIVKAPTIRASSSLA